MGKARLVAIGAALGYLATGIALWGCQSRLIFEPGTALSPRPAQLSFPIVEVAIAQDGPGRLNGWWIPAAQSPLARGKTVLYLHGNDGTVASSTREVAPLRALGYSVLLVDYRGFGISPGPVPSEASVYRDAEAAWNYLIGEKNINPKALYIYGHSLGGAIAIELARRHPEAAGLVVESSFTSIYDMARLEKRYALLPVDLFLNQRFDSLSKVGELKLPVLFLHGTADEIVPFAMGERLFAATGAGARFVAIEGGRHDHDEAGEAVIRGALREFAGPNAIAALSL